MSKRSIAIITLLALFSLAGLASVFGTIKTIVHDPQHRPVQGAQVEVQSRTSAFKTSGTTNEEGMALLSNVPVGEYDIKIVSPGFSGAQQSVTVSFRQRAGNAFCSGSGATPGNSGSVWRARDGESFFANAASAGQPERYRADAGR